MDKPKYEFKRIDNIEVSPIGFEVKDKSCLGCQKTNTDMMLIIRHGHSSEVMTRSEQTDAEPIYYTGQVHIMLTKLQIVSLINELDKALHLSMGAEKSYNDAVNHINKPIGK